FCRKEIVPPLLLRLALVEGGHRQLPTDQKGLSRGILDVFCSCLQCYASYALANAGIPNAPGGGECGVHPDVRLWDACVLPFLSRSVRSPQANTESVRTGAARPYA